MDEIQNCRELYGLFIEQAYKKGFWAGHQNATEGFVCDQVVGPVAKMELDLDIKEPDNHPGK